MVRLSVRLATLADAEALAHCHVACWVEAYGGLVPAEVLNARTADREAQRARWAAALQGDSRTWVAVVAAEVVGFASAGPPRDDELAHLVELYALYIRARAYGSGLADQLTNAALAREAAYLWVLAANPRAQAYYRKLGFRHDGHTKRDPRLGGVLETRMIRA
ncbi:MAG: GNAT family N-acetyltransferase [Actinomycetota bacterium]|nr:GNAT family N-acetyltransferase [Nocardioidaceae bacterium]MDQ3592917.1 GNAT family N-acetyltransferase [Actinomycetota bacterium]